MTPELQDAFARQGRACATMGSAFMAGLMAVLPEVWPAGGELADAVARLPGAPGPEGASIPLRVASGLHALVLAGRDPALAAVWPGGEGGDLREAVAQAMVQQGGWLADWVQRPPQTNEVGRSAPLAAAARVVVARTGLPLALFELGASAGLNLLFDRHAAPGSPVDLRPVWTGEGPPDVPLPVLTRRGVDLTPLSPVTDALRLTACVWPDQAARLARLRAALAVAASDPPQVDRGDAGNWLAARLAEPVPAGVVRFVFHTIAFQYFPPATQDRVRATIEAAGGRATDTRPLAHVALEADATPGSAALTLRLWPGGAVRNLARAGFHGEWIDWRG